MTRCECAGVSFDEIVRLVRVDGLSLEAACRRTGVGDLCTACLPDLKATLRAR
jgi:bacterioferritin-associated ferredoxin